MKKNTLFLLMGMLFIGYPLLAQLGFQAGAVFSSAKEKYEGMSMEFGTKTGFIVGAFYRHDFAEKFAFQPEVNFLQRGGKYSETFDEGDGTYEMDIDLDLNYLEIPLYFLYNGGKPSGFYGGLGPSFNFGLSGKVNENGDSYDIDFGSDGDLKPFFLGINAMVGYQMQNGITANAFVSQSITNSDTDEESDATFNMFSFGIRLGYMMNFNKTAKTNLKPAL